MNFPQRRTVVMGVLNITPDSFSDGGLFMDSAQALAHAKQMVQDGADIVDVGGESTRPGAKLVSQEEELRRVKPVVDLLVREGIVVSIDTQKPGVAEECLQKGASLVNDVSGLKNEAMAQIVARHNVPVVIMHMKGTPQDMQQDPAYERGVVEEIKEFFRERIQKAKEAGIQDIILDPGIGFGKTLEHNLEILRRLSEFKDLGYPLLIGTSRKSFIGKLMGNAPPEERLEGTIASMIVAVMNGARFVRVHDVKECKRALLVADAIIHG